MVKKRKNIIQKNILLRKKYTLMNYKLISIVLLYMALSISCNDKKVIIPPVQINNYIHISHTRTNSNPNMDSIVETINFNKFDMLWLGGDLAHLTSENDNTMYHVDSIFNIGNPNTLWSLGNHDYSDLSRISDFTNRPPYYSFYKNGITFLILDTQDSLSNITGAQKLIFENIIDTIQESSHFVILHHKLIWMYGNTSLEPEIPSISNGGLGDCFYCINPNNFYIDIYPRLLEVKQKGIEVICIGGDIGFKVKEFEYITPDTIYFLASGISSGTLDNKALLFQHDIGNRTLTWEYKLIKDL